MFNNVLVLRDVKMENIQLTLVFYNSLAMTLLPTWRWSPLAVLIDILRR